jgi:hypothetical protein
MIREAWAAPTVAPTTALDGPSWTGGTHLTEGQEAPTKYNGEPGISISITAIFAMAYHEM